MRTKTFLILIGLVVVLGAAATGGVYAYDSGHSDRIAKGISVSGVDVGGMSTADARAVLQRRLLTPLKKPVTVRYEGKRFRLTPRQAQVGIDVDGSVERALQRSRSGSALSRTLRDVRGNRVEADLPVEVNHSEAAVRRLVRRVAEEIDRPAQDADVSFAGGRIDRKPSHEGLAVRESVLRREVRRKLLSVGGSRRVRVRTRVVEPKVTTAKVAEKYPAVLMVDRKSFRLTLYKDLKPAQTYGIAVGRVGLATPAGLYSIQNKAIDPAWHVPNSTWAGSLAGKTIPGGTPENPIKSRWLGIYGGVGIHGTSDDSSIGSNASHGCIRMHVPDVKKLYDEVPVGAPVYIS